MVVKDRLLAALAAEKRRFVCRYLLSREDSIALEELTAVLVAEAEEPDREPTIDEGSFDQSSAMLHHHHLPKLAEANLVQYDPERLLVEAGTALPYAEPILDVLDEMNTVQSRM